MSPDWIDENEALGWSFGQTALFLQDNIQYYVREQTSFLHFASSGSLNGLMTGIYFGTSRFFGRQCFYYLLPLFTKVVES